MIIEMNNEGCLLAGGKAKGLYELFSMGLRVPEFFVITSDSFIGLLREARKEGCSLSDAELIKGLDFPEDFISEIYTFADTLGCEMYAVRSSAEVEDGNDRSFAGQFETVLSVTRDRLLDAIRRVWLSAYKPKGEGAYCIGENTKISVIVQKQISPDFAGVCFSTSPASKASVLIEYVEGAGEKLVSGAEKPTKIEAEKNKPLENPLFEELRSTAAALEERLGLPLDFEFAISEGVLYFLQMRPLTVSEFSSYSLPEGSYSMYVSRDFPWYVHSVQIKASLPEEQLESYGFATPITEGALILGEEYYSERSDRITEEIFEGLSVKDYRLFDRRISKLLRRVNKASRIISRLPSSLSRAALSDITEFFESIYLESYIPMMMRPDDYLAKKLSSLAPGCDLLSLSFVSSYTDYRGQAELFSKILKARAKGKPAGRHIAKYLKKYSYLLPEDERSAESVIERVNLLNAEGNNSKDGSFPVTSDSRFVCKENSRRENIKRRQAEEKRLSGVAREYARLLSRFVYYRTRVAECSDKLYYTAKKHLFPLISAARGLKENEIELLGHGELTSLLRVGDLPSGLQIRALGHFAVWRDGVPTVGFGLPPKELVQMLRGTHSADSSVLFGDAASLGRVTGKVKIVRTPNDARELSLGEIMVASMTTPDYTVAFSKAAGFITDEGGISCHASIIARELCVPCIVGVGCATALLSDGDTVMLDAYEGTVTILEKNTK